MNWKRFTTLFVSIVLLLCAEEVIHACADSDDPYDYFPSFFFNDINQLPVYTPFFYSGLVSYYGEYEYYADSLPALPDANVEEWYKYCDEKAAKPDIDSFVYKFSYSDFKILYNNIAKGAKEVLPLKVSDNSFAHWLSSGGNIAAMEYLLFAKQCEPFAQPQDGYYDKQTYDWKTIPRDTAKMEQLVTQGQALYNSCKDDYLKWRYAYQIIRMSFYSNNNTQAIALYDKLTGDKTYNGIMYARCLALKAGALFRNGDKKQAAYLYSRVFDISDEMKKSAYFSFDWATGGDINDILPLCSNDHQKAVLYVMDGLHEYKNDDLSGLPLMEQAYKADPGVAGLDIIMTREINKAEEKYATGRDNSNLQEEDTADQALQRTYPAYLQQLNAFAQKMAADGKNGRKAFWYLSSAYIYQLLNDFDNCKKYLDIAAAQNMTDREKDVHDAINTLYLVRRNGKITPTVEQQLLPSLQWIAKRSVEDSHFRNVYDNILQNIMAPAYLKQGDTIKAVYCLSPSVGYENGFMDNSGEILEKMSPQRVADVLAFVQKADKTPFERWLLSNKAYTPDVLNELEGTKYIRLHQFGKAVAILQKVPDTFLNKIVLPDCFTGHIQDMQDWNKADSAVTYTKRSFAQKMVALEQKILANPKDAKTIYSYANGLYSMTYYGKGWEAYSYYRSGSDDNGYYAAPERAKLQPCEIDYYTASTAEKYYALAASNASDPDLKAKCLYMAAKCWQKSCPAPIGKDRYDYDDNLYFINSLTNPYFNQLRSYKHTKFYSDAFNTCAYLKDYMMRN